MSIGFFLVDVDGEIVRFDVPEWLEALRAELYEGMYEIFTTVFYFSGKEFAALEECDEILQAAARENQHSPLLRKLLEREVKRARQEFFKIYNTSLKSANMRIIRDSMLDRSLLDLDENALKEKYGCSFETARKAKQKAKKNIKDDPGWELSE